MFLTETVHENLLCLAYRLIFFENLKNNDTLWSRKALNGSHPSSASRAYFGIFILVRIVTLAAWYWWLSNKSFCAADEENHIKQPCTEFHNAQPNSIRLKLPCLPKILIIQFKLSSIVSLMWLPICWVRTKQIYPKVFVFISFFNICTPKYSFIRLINIFSYYQYFWFIWIKI